MRLVFNDPAPLLVRCFCPAFVAEALDVLRSPPDDTAAVHPVGSGRRIANVCCKVFWKLNLITFLKVLSRSRSTLPGEA